MSRRELQARLLSVRNVFPARDEGEPPTLIVSIWHEGREHTAKGVAWPQDFLPSCVYRFWGQWRTHHRHGDQFHFESAVREAPSGEAAMTAYLQSAPRIGPVIARRLFSQYGESCVATLRESPELVAEAVKGLSQDAAAEAAKFLRSDEVLSKAKIDLTGVLHGRGVPRKTVEKLLKDYGSAAAEMIKRNPYLLMRYRGCGFLKADKVYLELGHDPSRMKRQGLCAWHSIASKSGGDTWFAESVVKKHLNESISGTGVDCRAAIALMLRARGLAERYDMGTRWVAEFRKASAERDVAEMLADAECEPVTLWPRIADVVGLSEHQAEQAELSTAGVVGILAGSPGTGKTYTVAAIVRFLLSSLREDQIAICAPTGKAAVRCSEAMSNAGVPLKAQTIHSLLGVLSADDGWSFQHNRKNPLQHAVIIVDECFPKGTLVDTPNGARSIEAICSGESIINASGSDIVLATKRKEVFSAVSIIAGETRITCSENHPIFTARGVVFACDLKPGDSILQTAEAMRLLRNDDTALRRKCRNEAFLRSVLLNEMVDVVPGIQSSRLYKRTISKDGAREKQVSELRDSRGQSSGPEDSGTEPDDFSPWHGSQGVGIFASNRTQTTSAWRERNRTNKAAVCIVEDSRTGMDGGSGNNTRRSDSRIPNLLQGGPWEPGNDAGYRVRWQQTLQSDTASDRFQEGPEAGFSRVDRVEIFQQGDSRLDEFRDADGKLYFYDLQAARHQSFSISGLLVHNCSMLDVDLMRSLMVARPRGTHLLAVGDPSQLAPVGHGAPLRDMIAAGIPCGTLTEIRRNSGRIVQTCAEIRDRQTFTPSAAMVLPEENLVLMQRGDPEQQIQTLSHILNVISRGDFQPEVKAALGEIDPVWDVQVICAVNKKGELSRRLLNKEMQKLLNPDGATVDGCPFRVGDKIINTKNARFDEFVSEDSLRRQRVYHNDDKKPETPQHYVANGEQAEVLAVEPARIVARLTAPDRTIVIYRGATKAAGSGDGRDEDEDDESGDEDEGDTNKTNTGCSWELGYAISCHKSQGSEWKIVIGMIDGSSAASRVQSREYFYTLISRGKTLCMLIGDAKVLGDGIKRSGLWKRKTFLRELICERRAAEMFSADEIDSLLCCEV